MARKSRKSVDATIIEAAPVTYNAAAYLRLSADARKKRGDSLETQRSIIESFIADSPDIRLEEVYTDNSLTGTNFDRPGFLKMLADAESGKINCIIVKDLTRFGRNAVDALYYIEKHLPSLGVRFIAVTDPFDSNDGDGGIMLPLKNVIAESYALDISRKCRAVQRQNIQQGRYVGRLAPFGYSKHPKDCRKLIIDEEAAPVVRQIFEWAASSVSVNEIAKRLSAAGTPIPSQRNHDKGLNTSEKLLGSGYWKANVVRNILADRVYIGDMVQGKTQTLYGKRIHVDPSEWVCVENTHEPIIDCELFERVQVLRSRVCKEVKGYASYGAYTPNIFKGKIFCACCKRPMHRKRQNKDGIYLFYCDTRWQFGKDACVQVSIKEAALKTEMIEILNKYSEVVRGKSISIEKTVSQDGLADSTKELREINLNLDKAERMLKSLYENLVSGLITQDEYTQMRARYLAKIERYSGQSNEIRKRRHDAKAKANEYSAFSQAAAEVISSSDLTAELLDKLVEKIQVRPDKSFHTLFKFMDELGESGEVRRCG